MASDKNPRVGMRIRIKQNAPFFAGCEAVVAYVGTEGVSAYLVNHAFDDCVPLNNDEWELSGE